MNLKYVGYGLCDGYEDGVFVTEETVENAIRQMNLLKKTCKEDIEL